MMTLAPLTVQCIPASFGEAAAGGLAQNAGGEAGKFRAGIQSFGHSFHLLGADCDSRQLVQQSAALFKTDQRSRTGGHAQNPRREGKRFQSQAPVARTESALARLAVIVSPLEAQGPEYAFEGLLVTTAILGRAATRAGQFRFPIIALQPSWDLGGSAGFSCGMPSGVNA